MHEDNKHQQLQWRRRISGG